MKRGKEDVGSNMGDQLTTIKDSSGERDLKGMGRRDVRESQRPQVRVRLSPAASSKETATLARLGGEN